MFDQSANYNPMGGMGMQPNYNYQGMAQPVQKFNNVLTAEQIKELQQQGQQFSLQVTNEEFMRGVCNHRNLEGTGDSLVFDPLTGEARCTICGYKFKPIEANVTSDEIKEDVERIVDILQTIKLMYIDFPAEAAKEFFPIIPLLEKVPQLFEFAAKNMTKHESYNWQYNNRNMGAINMFNNLQNIFGAGMGFQPQQPQQAVPSMPMMPQAGPVGAMPPVNAFGYPGAGMANPAFGNYQPQTAGFQFVPNQTAAPVVAPSVDAPVAPANPAETTVTQNVTV